MQNDDYLDGEDNGNDDIKLSSTLASITSPNPHSCLVHASVNDVSIIGFIDTGADNSFVEKSFLIKNSIKFNTSIKRDITLANNSTFSIAGALNASIKVGDNLYKNTHLLVTDSLVAPLIIGCDILGRHSSISVYLGGWDNKASFCASLKSLHVEPPELLQLQLLLVEIRSILLLSKPKFNVF